MYPMMLLILAVLLLAVFTFLPLYRISRSFERRAVLDGIGREVPRQLFGSGAELQVVRVQLRQQIMTYVQKFPWTATPLYEEVDVIVSYAINRALERAEAEYARRVGA